MTVPPPPAVPGELIEKAPVSPDLIPSETLKRVQIACSDPGAFVKRGDNYAESLCAWQARAVLAALNIGDIMEAARRDALEDAAAAIAKEREDDRGYRVAAGFDENPCDVPHGECHAAAAYFAFDTAARIVTDLRSAP